MRRKNEPASIADVTKALAAVQKNIKKLVMLLGDPDDVISNEACTALITVGPPAAEPLAAAILRPVSPLQRVKAIFAVRLIRPKGSLSVQKALYRVAKQQKGERIGESAGIVLSDLLLDEVEDVSRARHREHHGPALLGLASSTIRTEPEESFFRERLSALDAQE